ncbi:MAG: UDP-N-acetylmuramoyl-L-alanyl-D-glutamate--2,6-diaminopimelate ligase [Gammaproteobacteria bacterium CG22_combo_CG10-13_8_21_14_all_40_8]|nr:MAG: UDP-N-acetylmuramoyl-L-alanyl-D-glutamate--2,6-diaminopimelate ligase [Gammaproteobacteria bacterium CG22_combo_CG10-13_8_21_14_all_40_8]
MTHPLVLKELLKLMPDHQAFGDMSQSIQCATLSSKESTQGCAFIAVPGAMVDGRDYIKQAVENGVTAVFCEENGLTPEQQKILNQLTIPWILVKKLSLKIGIIANAICGNPAAKMKLIGITGTNGKTSICQLLAQIIYQLAGECGQMGTIGNGLVNRLVESINTTSEAITIHKNLAKMLEAGARYVAMEVSSHALAQGRVEGLHYEVAVFTNLTRDHLDYHQNMQDYAEAKRKLFLDQTLPFVVINADDAFGLKLLADPEITSKKIAYSTKNNPINIPKIFGVVRASEVQYKPKGMSFNLETPWGDQQVELGLLGEFNLSNCLAVIGVLGCLGFDRSEFISSLEQQKAIPGRMECFGGGGKPSVVVDYAHTPDALEKALLALRAHANGEIWCIFGCGGDRDPGKRPMMALAAEKYADHLIITDDNPRNEDGNLIVADILSGLKRAGFAVVERDRNKAIRLGILNAKPNDIVLIAGKGHETYQLIQNVKHAHSDREFVQQQLQGVIA